MIVFIICYPDKKTVALKVNCIPPTIKVCTTFYGDLRPQKLYGLLGMDMHY